MSYSQVLLAALAAQDGVRIVSVEPVPGAEAFAVEMERVVDGSRVGAARFLYHIGKTPWEIAAVLSMQITAASWADRRFMPPTLVAELAASIYPGGSADASRELVRLLGNGRYELYMQSHLDSIAAEGDRLAAAVEANAPRAGGGSGTGGGNCALVLLVLVAAFAATLIVQLRG